MDNITLTPSLSDMRQLYIYILGRGWNGASPSHGGRGGGGGDRGSRAPLSPRNPRYEELVSYCRMTLPNSYSTLYYTSLYSISKNFQGRIYLVTFPRRVPDKIQGCPIFLGLKV